MMSMICFLFVKKTAKRLLQEVGEYVVPLLGESFILGLDEDADFVLGTGIADNGTARAGEFLVCFCDKVGIAGNLGQRGVLLDVEAAEFLRIFFHESGELVELFVFLLHELEDVERGNDTVAGGGVIEEDQVTGLFAAEGEASSGGRRYLF